MKSIRSVEAVLAPPPPHMVGDGFRVHNFFPGTKLIGKTRMSPFFLLDYGARIEFAPSQTPRGVGVHPHAGFETVTIAYHGKIAHHDSAGHHGIIGEGEVQWMTAGSGILHKEYHEEEFSRRGGSFQMVQLWVNLPAKFKKTKPRYQEITSNMIGRYHLPEQQGWIEIIAGEYNQVKGPASTFTPIQLYNARIRKGTRLMFQFPQHFNTGLLIVEGNIKVNDINAHADHFVLMKNDGQEFTIHATQDSIILLLSGEPIQEPVVAYGPFVMNTWEEIEKAMDDVNAGKFGMLE